MVVALPFEVKVTEVISSEMHGVAHLSKTPREGCDLKNIDKRVWQAR